MDLVLYNPSKWKTWILSFLSLTGISVSSYYLQKDFTSVSSLDRGEALGQVLLCDPDAKRKHSDSYLWTRLTLAQPVYFKDQIRVGPQGYATIQLMDGSKIELGENSLVIIDDPKTVSFKFVRGSFIIADRGGERAVSVAKDGQALERELFVKAITPTPAAKFFAKKDGTMAMELHWEFQPNATASVREGARILISRDRLFLASDVISQPISDLPASGWKGSLPAGRYYWKIMGAKENLSEVRDFTVVGIEPLVPLSPNNGDIIALFTGQRRVPLRWIPAEATKKTVVTLELSHSEKFSPLHLNQAVDSAAGLASVEALEPGDYYWRLKSSLSSETLYSRIASFTIKAKGDVELRLSDPPEATTVELGPEMRFSWDVLDGDFDYLWEVQAPSLERSIVFNTKGGSVLWTPEKADSYRWRVVTKLSQSKVGGSEWRGFRVITAKPIALLKPQPQEKIGFWDKSGKVDFSWTEQPGGAVGSSYRLKISEESGFKKGLKLFRTDKPTFEWHPGPSESGYRFWMVEWLGKSGEVLRLSGARQFYFGMAGRLLPPMPQTPLADAVISLNDSFNDPELVWGAQEKAVGYEVNIQKDGRPWRQTVEKEAHHKLTELKPGVYRWSVRAIDSLKRTGEASIQRRFTVRRGTKLRAPTKTEWEVE